MTGGIPGKRHGSAGTGNAQVSLGEDWVAEPVQLGGEKTVEEVALLRMDTLPASSSSSRPSSYFLLTVILSLAGLTAAGNGASAAAAAAASSFGAERILIGVIETARVKGG